MDGQDLQRRAPARHPARRSIEALKRGQRPPETGTAADVLRAERDPERKFEPLRRAAGNTGRPL
jgi:hypothetical protein